MTLKIDVWKKWKNEVTEIVNNIRLGDNWELSLKEDKLFNANLIDTYAWVDRTYCKGGRLYLQISFHDKDNVTGEYSLQKCRKWYLSPYMTTTEVVRTAHKAYEAAVLHEMNEKFKYKGVAIYNPHTNVEDLVEVQEKAKDVR